MRQPVEAFVRSWLASNVTPETVLDEDGVPLGQSGFETDCINAAVLTGFPDVQHQLDIGRLVEDYYDEAVKNAV